MRTCACLLFIIHRRQPLWNCLCWKTSSSILDCSFMIFTWQQQMVGVIIYFFCVGVDFRLNSPWLQRKEEHNSKTIAASVHMYDYSYDGGDKYIRSNVQIICNLLCWVVLDKGLFCTHSSGLLRIGHHQNVLLLLWRYWSDLLSQQSTG